VCTQETLGAIVDDVRESSDENVGARDPHFHQPHQKDSAFEFRIRIDDDLEISKRELEKKENQAENRAKDNKKEQKKERRNGKKFSPVGKKMKKRRRTYNTEFGSIVKRSNQRILHNKRAGVSQNNISIHNLLTAFLKYNPTT
jgi:hypothetical protein